MNLQFCHITKTGGSSLEIEALRSHKIYWGINNRVLWDNIAKNAGVNHKESWHTPLSFVTESYMDTITKNYTFFTVVRNPYSRAISEYYCQFGSRYFFQHKKIKSEDINIFNKHLSNGLRKILNKFKSNTSKHLTHWQLQHRYILKNKEHVIQPENIIKYEEYETKLPKFLKTKSISITDIPRSFDSKICEKKFETKHLSKDNIALINEIYYEDFLILGYEIL